MPDFRAQILSKVKMENVVFASTLQRASAQVLLAQADELWFRHNMEYLFESTDVLVDISVTAGARMLNEPNLMGYLYSVWRRRESHLNEALLLFLNQEVKGV